MVNVSAHGNKRVRSRCGVPKKTVNKLASEAFSHGISHKETTGSLNKYITALYFYNQSANNIRIHKNKVFIFAGSRLVTVLNLPPRFQKSVNNCIKKRGLISNE
jgi:hypothetical protein